MDRIAWKKDVKEALEDMAGGSRLALLFFHHPTDEGSKKTIEQTLNDDDVVHLIERECSAVAYNVEKAPGPAKEHRVDWMPTFIFLDEEGRELERWVGYLPPKDFIAQLLLSKGLCSFHLERYGEAMGLFEELVEKCPESDLVPEAEYFIGAADYKVKGDAVTLARMCQDLETRFPGNIWTKKCSIWSHTGMRRPFVPYSGGNGVFGGGS